MSPLEVMSAVERMSGWQGVPVDVETVSTAMQLIQQHAMSYWDAQLAASAARAGCHLLLTEDLSGPDVILGVRRENPFA